ncbi:hypothetical protein [Streptomyces cyaneofuscatus]|uniref:hypothetical protein n=1 Tax=Streptomyces cyaneofuscatus TaxID=66883 RepID=UPI0036DC7FEC
MTRRLDDDQRAAVRENASLDSIRAMLRAERRERLRVDARVAWLERLQDQRTDQLLAGTWPAPVDAEQPDPTPAVDDQPDPAPDPCPQNLYSERLVRLPHHPDAGSCTFCTGGRTYAFNATSVNHMVKHAHDSEGRTLCPRRFRTNPPMTNDRALGLPLCPGCRVALETGTEAAV